MPEYHVVLDGAEIGGSYGRLQTAINCARAYPGAVVVDDGADKLRVVWRDSKGDDNHGND